MRAEVERGIMLKLNAESFSIGGLIMRSTRPLLSVSTILFIAVPALVLASCETYEQTKVPQSIEDTAYSACVDSYNNNYAGLESYKAMAAGANATEGTCFWIDGKHDPLDALLTVKGACEKQYADCWLFASSSGLSDWAKQKSEATGRSD